MLYLESPPQETSLSTKFMHERGGIPQLRGVRSSSLNISTRVDKREQVSTILVNISVNEAVVFTSIFQLLVVLALLGGILDADWSENDVRIGWSSVYCTMGRH